MKVFKLSHMLTILFILNHACALKERCTYIGYRGNQNKGGGMGTNGTKQCVKRGVCKKNFRISHIDTPPYSTSRIFEGLSIVEYCILIERKALSIRYKQKLKSK